MKTVCIMGGGLGGLMTGALLAKEGYRVTVLEKNSIIGGGLQSFRRGSYLFDTGMHIFGGMGADGQIRRICRHLGIEERVRTVPVQVMVNGIREELPEAYIDKIRALTDKEPLYNLRHHETSHLPDMNLTAKEMVKEWKSGKVEEWKSVMYPALLYGAREDSPALLHALIGCAHQRGTYTFVGGSLHFAELLAEVIVAGGGEVRCGEAVTKVETFHETSLPRREVTAVLTEKGRYSADYYINDIPIGRLLELMPERAFAPAFRKRIESVPYSMSAMTLFIGLKPRSMRYDGTAHFVMKENCNPWDMDGCCEKEWPQALFAIGAEDADNPGFASTITAICPMKYDYVERWADSHTGRRPEEYYRWKEKMAAQALELLSTVEPFHETALQREMVACLEAGTPLTIRDYYGTPRGALYGIHRSSENPMQSSLNTRTRLNNLYLTGQDVNFHGLIGTSLTAIMTAETIVGRNVIVNKL